MHCCADYQPGMLQWHVLKHHMSFLAYVPMWMSCQYANRLPRV